MAKFKDQAAFCCKSCGRVHRDSAAGENHTPHACEVCGAGVSFDPKTGAKKFDADNWEVLHHCSDTRLKELGLGRDGVVEHVGEKPIGGDHFGQRFVSNNNDSVISKGV